LLHRDRQLKKEQKKLQEELEDLCAEQVELGKRESEGFLARVGVAESFSYDGAGSHHGCHSEEIARQVSRLRMISGSKGGRGEREEDRSPFSHTASPTAAPRPLLSGNQGLLTASAWFLV
jgi:hypothetical protein